MSGGERIFEGTECWWTEGSYILELVKEREQRSVGVIRVPGLGVFELGQ